MNTSRKKIYIGREIVSNLNKSAEDFASEADKYITINKASIHTFCMSGVLFLEAPAKPEDTIANSVSE